MAHVHVDEEGHLEAMEGGNGIIGIHFLWDLDDLSSESSEEAVDSDGGRSIILDRFFGALRNCCWPTTALLSLAILGVIALPLMSSLMVLVIVILLVGFTPCFLNDWVTTLCRRHKYKLPKARTHEEWRLTGIGRGESENLEYLQRILSRYCRTGYLKQHEIEHEDESPFLSWFDRRFELWGSDLITDRILIIHAPVEPRWNRLLAVRSQAPTSPTPDITAYWMQFARALENRRRKNWPIQMSISGYALTRTVVTSLGQALAAGPVHSINLSGTNSGRDGVRLMAQLLRNKKTLKVFGFSRQDLDKWGAREISKAMKAHPTLRSVSLSACQINDAILPIVLKGCKSVTNLDVLNLYANKISVESFGELETYLSNNSVLRVLKLGTNCIPREQEEKLTFNCCLKASDFGSVAASNHRCCIIFDHSDDQDDLNYESAKLPLSRINARGVKEKEKIANKLVFLLEHSHGTNGRCPQSHDYVSTQSFRTKFLPDIPAALLPFILAMLVVDLDCSDVEKLEQNLVWDNIECKYVDVGGVDEDLYKRKALDRVYFCLRNHFVDWPLAVRSF